MGTMTGSLADNKADLQQIAVQVKNGLIISTEDLRNEAVKIAQDAGVIIVDVYQAIYAEVLLECSQDEIERLEKTSPAMRVLHGAYAYDRRCVKS